MISSNYIATYQGETRRIDFIYPNNSDIIYISAYDLYSMNHNIGPRNKEKGTLLVTPEVLEKTGIKIATEQGEDLYSSRCNNAFFRNEFTNTLYRYYEI